jgi:hypothetical protein
VTSIPDQANMFVLGHPFMRSYTFALDYSAGIISLATNSEVPQMFNKPSNDDSISAWAITFIVLGVALFLIIIAFVISLLCKKNNTSERLDIIYS